LKTTLSAHAFERAKERGITAAEIISVLTRPDSKTQRHRSKKTGGFVYLFTKEIGGRKLCVADDLYKDDCVVVTTYWK
jgi:hypothetical protein